MNFEIISHRHAEEIISANTEYNEVYQSLENTINSISDNDLISQFYSSMSGKSLNNTLNNFIFRKIKIKWVEPSN